MPFRSGSSIGYQSRSDSTVTPPAGIVNGDGLIAVMFIGHATAVPPVTPPAGWTELGVAPTMISGGSVLRVQFRIWTKRAASESGNYVFQHTTANTQVWIGAWDSILTSGPFIGAYSANNNATNIPDIQTNSLGFGITTTAPNSRLIYFAHDWTGSGALTPPAGMTERFDNLVYVADEARPTAGPTGDRSQINANSGANQHWTVRMVELLQEAPAVPGPAYVSGSYSTYTSRTNIPLASPASGMVADDVALAMIATVASSPPIPNASGWTELGTATVVTSAGLSARLTLLWKRVTATELGDVTFNHATCNSVMWWGVFKGAKKTGDPFGAASNNTGFGQVSTGLSITTTAAKSLLLWLGQDWAASANKAGPSGMYEMVDTTLIYSAYQLIAATGATGNKVRDNNNTVAGDPWAVRMVELLAEPSGVIYDKSVSIAGMAALNLNKQVGKTVRANAGGVVTVSRQVSKTLVMSCLALMNVTRNAAYQKIINIGVIGSTVLQKEMNKFIPIPVYARVGTTKLIDRTVTANVNVKTNLTKAFTRIIDIGVEVSTHLVLSIGDKVQGLILGMIRTFTDLFGKVNTPNTMTGKVGIEKDLDGKPSVNSALKGKPGTLP